jgi:hypothetical protein
MHHLVVTAEPSAPPPSLIQPSKGWGDGVEVTVYCDVGVGLGVGVVGGVAVDPEFPRLPS